METKANKIRRYSFIVFTYILAVTMTFFYIKTDLNKSDRAKIKSLKRQNDSLSALVDTIRIEIDSIRHENFLNYTTIGRYDVALEYLREVDKKAAEKFEYFLYNKTE